jgi:myosin heavy subunit
MMQQQQSNIDKIFAYDNATEKAKYDILYERQRVDRLQHELNGRKWDANPPPFPIQPPLRPTNDTVHDRNTAVDSTIHHLQQQNECLHQQLHEITMQLQKSVVAAPIQPSQQPSKQEHIHTFTSSASLNSLQESETKQQRQTLELSLSEYKKYCKELEQRMDEQRVQHTHTVEILQQQVMVLQDSLQTTRQRLATRDAELDRLSTELKEQQQQKRGYPLYPPASTSQLPHTQPQHDSNNKEFPISPLSMTDSMMEGAGRCHNHFDNTTTTFTTPHTDTIVTIPQLHNNSNNTIQENHENIIIDTTTTTASAMTTVADKEVSVDLPPSSSSCQSVTSSSTSITNVNHHMSQSIESVTTASTLPTRKLPPQIRSDVDRAKAMEQLEYERIHNARIVQQLRQSVLLQQQQHAKH